MSTDKLDTHYFQQLSALMDGDLPADQARFLLRRMQHDTELTACLGRWQLYGDALRGQALAPAPAGFADRIAAAVVEESPHARPASGGSRIRRRVLARWGGGALAASMAAMALFVARQQVPEERPVEPVPAVARHSADKAGSTANTATGAPAATTMAAASVAVASAPRRATDATRRSATRSQQAARSAAAVRTGPERALASASVPVVHAIARLPVAAPENGDPFSAGQLAAPAARPWPRAVSPQYSSGSGGFNAEYSTERAMQTFYPFEPRLPPSPTVATPATTTPDR